LSGPAMLQISSYWQPGDVLKLNLLPDHDMHELLIAWRRRQPQAMPEKLLTQFLPRRLAQVLVNRHGRDLPMQGYSNRQLAAQAAAINDWSLQPAGTEGYRTAEVTLGGVDTRQISSQTFECNAIAGLFFIGEVLDVTGHLGGHNFQWAWASAVAAGQAV
ncbi:MAG: NAD(P)/FAD-dependent oxidoreductase, partial [Gammaproteobacteria bacterium]